MGVWEIIGGGAKGGILVRTGQDLKSPEEKDRLSTGAIVEELKLAGERLNYKLVSGTGPAEGWISIALKGNALAKKKEDVEPAEPAPPAEGPPAKEQCADRSLWSIKSGDDIPPALPPPARPAHLTAIKKLPPWSKPPVPKGSTVGDVIKQTAKGDLYGLEFPFTMKMLKDPLWGPKWLTDAFHKAGSMPKDNKVKKIKELKELPMSGYDAAGGAGMKGLLTVEYAKADPELHTELFVKVPFAEGDNMTWRMNMSMFGDPDGAEISSYQFLSHLLPFRIPKLYFADIARSTTNYILITEKIAFMPKGTECKPYEIHPSTGKCQDFDLKDPVKPYYALFRAMARMAAWDKQRRFDGVKVIFEESTFARMGGREKFLAGMKAVKDSAAAATPEQREQGKKDYYNNMMTSQMKKSGPFKRHVTALLRFITELAPWLFPEDCKEKAFLDALPKQLEFVFKIAGVLQSYSTEGEKAESFFGLIHPNLQVDNAFFWEDEDGLYHAGLLDWGGCGYYPYAQVFLGCTTMALPEVYLEHEEGWFRTFTDEFKRFGGGEIDPEELILQSRLMFSVFVGQTCQRVATEAMQLTTPEEWLQVKDRFDERVMGRWNVRNSATAGEVSVIVWRRGKHWQTVLDFCKANGIDTEGLS